MARSRAGAVAVIRRGLVTVAGTAVRQPSRQASVDAAVVVGADPGADDVGRGARKLDDVLTELASRGAVPVVAGRRCLDAGASTGGFTQVLLARGARQVIAVDVGHHQLVDRVRQDARVVDLSGTTIRGLRPRDVSGPVDLLVADLSFISLTLVMGDLVRLVRPAGELLLLVKPQFEVGRARLRRGGVVREPTDRIAAVQAVMRAGQMHGLLPRAVRPSRYPGARGNVEYFVWCGVPGDGGVPHDMTPDGSGEASNDAYQPVSRPCVESGVLRAAALEDAIQAAVREGPT
ncbi:MAG: TlyA family RNA methyltransferase [Angustibacter sp.]